MHRVVADRVRRNTPGPVVTSPDLTRGACVGHPEPDLWFSDRRADKARARLICRTCPVQRECGTAAVAAGEFSAIRAGIDGDVLGRVAAQSRQATAPKAPPTIHATCGKPSGVRTHRRAGESSCDRCRTAEAAYHREARARARQRDQQDGAA